MAMALQEKEEQLALQLEREFQSQQQMQRMHGVQPGAQQTIRQQQMQQQRGVYERQQGRGNQQQGRENQQQGRRPSVPQAVQQQRPNEPFRIAEPRGDPISDPNNPWANHPNNARNANRSQFSPPNRNQSPDPFAEGGRSGRGQQQQQQISRQQAQQQAAQQQAQQQAYIEQEYLAPKWALRNLGRICLEFEGNLEDERLRICGRLHVFLILTACI